jgi:hypothetical protein
MMATAALCHCCAYSRTSISDRRAAGWTRKYLLSAITAVCGRKTGCEPEQSW